MGRIVIKTDASTRNDSGSGLAYQAIVFDRDDGGDVIEYKNRRYIESNVSSTDSEMYAVIYTLQKVYRTINNWDDTKKYDVVVESDCDYAVSTVNMENYKDKKMRRYVSFYRNKFDGLRARWIPRSENTVADSMARTTLQHAQ